MITKFYETIYTFRFKDTGELYQTDNLSQFCKEFGINYSNFAKMVKGVGYYHSVSGFELVNKEERV